MDRRNESEQREPVIPEKQRIVRRRRLLFSGQTSKQFQQETRNATSSLEGRTVSEQEVLSGDHSHISEVPSIYPVYHQALGNYKFYYVASGNPTTDDYAFIDCMALSRGNPLLHFTNDPDTDRFPSLDPTTGRTKYVRIGRSHGKDDWFWLPSSHQEAQQILRGSNQQMQEQVQDQQLLRPDLDPAGLSPHEANLTEQDESQAALSPENSPIRPGTERQKTASQKRREFTSQEPEPSAHPTEMRPTKKRKVMANQEPSRPRSYEEWKKSDEGQNPDLKPVRSPGGRIWGYDRKDFEGFLEKTKMQERPPEDQIEKRQLKEIVIGMQRGASKGEKTWTSPDPAIQKKLQERLSKRRINKQRKKIIEKQGILNKRRENPHQGANLSSREGNRAFGEAESSRPRSYEEWKKSDEGQNPNLQPVRSPGGQIYGYNRKDFEGFCEKTGMERRGPENQIKNKRYLSKVVDGLLASTANWTSPDPTIQEKVKEYLIKKRENGLKREKEKRLGKDPEFYKTFLNERYKEKQEEHRLEMVQLKESLEHASPSQQEELQKVVQDRKRIWKKFQEQYQIDMNMLEQLLQRPELKQRQQYLAIEGELGRLLQRYGGTNDELELHDLEGDRLNQEANLSPCEGNRAFGEAESSRPRSYEEWKKSDEGQNPHLQPVRSPGGRIYGYNLEDFKGFCEETKMQERASEDQIKNKRYLDKIVNGWQKATANWTSPNPEIQAKWKENVNRKNTGERDRRQELKNNPEKYEKQLIKQSIERIKNCKKANNFENLKRYLQKLMKDPKRCKAFFDVYLEIGYRNKKKQYKETMSEIDTRMKRARTSQQDSAGSNREYRKKGLQKVKQKLKSRWNNFQKDYQADQKKLDALIHQLEQLQQAPEQHPSPSQRDASSHQQQREFQPIQQDMEAIGKELEALIQRYRSNDHEFDLSELDALELYDMNNLGEHEIHDLENNLLNDLNL